MKQSMNKLTGLVAKSALALGLTAAVFAAGGEGMGGSPGTMAGPGMMGGPGAMGGPGMGPGMMGGSVADTAKRLADVKDQLAITPAQEGAWKSCEQAVISQSTVMNAHRQTVAGGSMPPAPDQSAAMQQQGMQAAQQTSQAAQALYQALTPDQQAKANNLLPLHPGYGMGR